MPDQSQKAGANSNQYQIQSYHEGLSLSDVIKVAELAAKKVVADEFARGDALGLRRIEAFNERIIAKMDSLGVLNSFADPAFHVSFRKAQIGAASTERESDYDLLASLLADRAVRGDERPVRAGLNVAIQVVDQLDEAALIGLTWAVSGMKYLPTAGNIEAGLSTLDALFAQFPVEGLPTGNDWIEHLDILGVVRITPFGGKLTPYEAFLAKQLPGYISQGIVEDSDELRLAEQTLQAEGIGLTIEPHLLAPGYMRLAFPSAQVLQERLTQVTGEHSRVDRTLQIAKEMFGLETPNDSLIPKFAEQLDRYPHLKLCRSWWNEVPTGFSVTAVGRLLARANADRLDAAKLLPPPD